MIEEPAAGVDRVLGRPPPRVLATDDPLTCLRCVRAAARPGSSQMLVRRIFTLYAAGASPNAIARRLNGESVPVPDGRPWRDSRVSGQRDRGTGLLNNELDIGRLAWNRCAYLKGPRSGNRLVRPNPPGRWERVAVPGLRIVADALWAA